MLRILQQEASSKPGRLDPRLKSQQVCADISINKDGQVLNAEKEPIPGLYAAGNAIGGLFYWNYVVGNQLTAAVIFGRRAAHDAVARAKEKSKKA